MKTLWLDVRYGLRTLAKNPGFSAVVIVVLALGIGTTTAMLSIVDAVLFRPPPYEDSDRLVYLSQGKATDTFSFSNAVSYANLVDWRKQNTVFEDIVGVANSSFRATNETRRERVFGVAVSPEYFPLLRIEPVLGRTFSPAEAKPGGTPVAIISHRFWQDWFGGVTDVIGKAVVLDEKHYTVIGVLPGDFRYASHEMQVWLPLAPQIQEWFGGTVDRDQTAMWAIARLKPGVTTAQAQTQMELIGRRLAEAYPVANEGTTVLLQPLTENYRTRLGQGRQALLITQGVVVVVLLIACLHVAGLLLIRSAARDKEFSVRAVLGAGRMRLMRQLLTEGLLLAFFGSLFGLLIAHWSLGVVSALRAGPNFWHIAAQIQKLLPWYVDLEMDVRSLFYALAISLLTCGVFGVLPAVLASKANVNRSLSAGRTPGHDLRFQRIRSALLVADTAIAFILLAGAGLLLNSYARLNTNLGYESKNILHVSLGLDESRPPYSQYSQRLAFYEQVQARLRLLPEVQFTAVAGQSPAWGGGNTPRVQIEGHSPSEFDSKDREGFPVIRMREISPDYCSTLQIPLLKGRQFTERDTIGTSPVMIVSASMAERYWPNENPVGKYVTQVKETSTDTGAKKVTRQAYQVVGVVGDARHFTGPKTGPPDPVAYVPYSQSEWGGYMSVLIRTNADPGGLAKAVRRELLTIEGNARIRTMAPLEDEIAELVTPQRFNMLSLGVFAAIALGLAAIGVYGVTAYAVSQRTHEIGIRMALGARRGDVLKAVLRQGLKLTLIGLTLGLVGAFAATRVIRSLLYNVSPVDPLTFACVALLLTGVALFASYLPARRAAKTDPMAALRYE